MLDIHMYGIHTLHTRMYTCVSTPNVPCQIVGFTSRLTIVDTKPTTTTTSIHITPHYLHITTTTEYIHIVGVDQ